MRDSPFDLAVIGGGIVGLATALAATAREPRHRTIVLEKETAIAAHQTGHNSGVIHSGIYYRPGSLKARLCVSGARAMEAFCDRHSVPWRPIGKLIVAVAPDEIAALATLHERANANGVPGVERIGPERAREIEPEVRCLAALHSPRTGIVDYREVCTAMRRELESRGGEVRTSAPVTAARERDGRLELATPGGAVEARFVVSCAGLHADRVARSFGADTGVRVVPFRGEYWALRPERHALVRGLVYPVPDSRYPFLGVHFTRTIHGEVEAGPNAVLAFAREGYSFGRVNARDLAETLGFAGFRRLAARHWRNGLAEMRRSRSRAVFARSLQRLVPGLAASDLVPGGAGVRAQAVTPEGEMVDDFHFVASPRALHVLNAPSPAATASLAIGELVAERIPAL